MSPILASRAGVAARGYGMLGKPAGPQSAFELWSSITLTSSTSTTFSSIPNTYASLQLRVCAVASSTSGYLYLRFNGDTGNNYAEHFLQGTGSVAQSGAYTSQSGILIGSLFQGTSSSYPNVGVIDILDYTSTTKNKVIRNLGGTDQNGAGDANLSSGLWLNTAAINSITVYTNGSAFANASFALYGIKGA